MFRHLRLTIPFFINISLIVIRSSSHDVRPILHNSLNPYGRGAFLKISIEEMNKEGRELHAPIIIKPIYVGQDDDDDNDNDGP
ncbi:unnamed protein product [Rhizophagus irregularis]|uniref:Uncharacterized protein n=1 Tax=Rhizophagus irregularis TaxID=588596 RepID=A0A915ZBX9_9GLOM|nr:unnamed protein product [Rhizophagus irregularis]